MGGSERLCKIGDQVLDLHADAAALHRAMREKLIHDLTRHVDRDREADADVAARAKNRRVDSDELALEVDERPARIAEIDGGIGLNEILVGFDAEAGATDGAHDTGGDGLAEPERVADGDDVVADLQCVRVGKRHGGQLRRVDL